ncbi:hypothetical protein BH24ACI3_BH24ACI3_02340 [soil metagenome]
MKKRILSITIFAGLILVSALEMTAQSTNLVSVRLGGDEKVAESGHTITFIELVEDSRCPEGVDCIQAGKAVIRVKVAADGREPQCITLETAETESKVEVHGYWIRLISLDPYPKADAETPRESYIAKISIERKPG